MSYQITDQALQQMQTDTFSRYLLDSSLLMESIRHFLRGEELVQETKVINGQEVVVETFKNVDKRKPPINEEGYNYTIQVLSPILDKIVSTTNLSEEEAGIHTRNIMNKVTVSYYLNYKQFGFNSRSEMDTIIAILLSLVYCQFKRGVDMETLKTIFSTYSIQELRTNEKRKNENIPTLTV